MARRLFDPLVLAFLVLPALVGGCESPKIGGKKGFSTANDELRTRVARLEEENSILKSQRDELAAKLAESNRAREHAIPPEILAAIPRCAGIQIDFLSSLFPTDASLPPTTLHVYVAPFDGQQRFVQIVGTLRVEAVQLGDPEGGITPDPATIATAILTPELLRGAYRSGVTGTHYSVELPIAERWAPTLRDHDVLIRAQFADALTGQVQEATRVLKARPAKR